MYYIHLVYVLITFKQAYKFIIKCHKFTQFSNCVVFKASLDNYFGHSFVVKFLTFH